MRARLIEPIALQLSGRKEGESMRQFNKRLESEASKLVLEDIRAHHHVSQKKREYRQKLKEKKKAKQQQRQEDKEDPFAKYKVLSYLVSLSVSLTTWFLAFLRVNVILSFRIVR